MFAIRNLIVIIILLCIPFGVWCQSAYVNTGNAIFQLTGGRGNCSYASLTNPCGVENSILSIAVHKDTVYYNTWNGELKRFRPGIPGSCETLIKSDFSYTAMVIDKNGIIYSGTEVLVRYNPHTNQLTHLGRMPFYSSGDMIFYKDKLLLAGSEPAAWTTGIFEINPDNLSASKLYMKTPAFIGLLSYPASCGKSRWFGISSNNTGNTRMIELDFDNKSVTGEEACSIPMNILDAASHSERETVISGIVRTNPASCGKVNGRIVVAAETENLPLTYTLLNAGTNQPTGEFTNLRSGSYQIRITDSRGCTNDTTIHLAESIPTGGCNDIFIPNAFTPNGDGKNDAFSFTIPPGIKDIALQIFNRWGNVVYKSRAGTIAWNGDDQPIGVYVYTFAYTNPDGTRINLRGTLNLIR